MEEKQEKQQEIKEKEKILSDRNRIIALIFVLFILYVPTATLLKGAFSGAGTPSGEIESTKKGQTAFVQLQNQITAFTKQMVFRKELITFNTELTLTMSGRNYIESTQVLLGKDDWLFYKTEADGYPLRDYMGTNCYTPEQLAELAANLTAIRDALEQERGIQFVIMNCPNKEQVYAEYMPETVVRISEESKADQAAAYIHANTDLTYVYLLDALLEAKEEYKIYYQTDTHWNQVGAFVGMQAVFEQLYGNGAAPDSVSFVINQEDFAGDLANIAGLTEEYAIDENYIFDKSTADPAQQRQETILIIGDSFSDFLRVIAEAYYEEVYVVRAGEFSMELLDQYDPDIVIWESVERYMDVFCYANLLEQ